MVTGGVLTRGLAVLFLVGSTFALANLAGRDPISGILSSKAFASTPHGIDDLDMDDRVGPNGDPSVSAASTARPEVARVPTAPTARARLATSATTVTETPAASVGY